MNEDQPNLCLACGTERPGLDEGFLCEECAAPGKVVVICACGHRCQLAPRSPGCSVLAERLGLAVVAGMAVRVTRCPSCGSPTIKGPMSVFRLKECVA